MNKELDQIVAKLSNILTLSTIETGIVVAVKELIEELTPKPEFMNGEIVVITGGVGSYSSPYDEGHLVNNNQFNAECKKLEALPMHMTKYDGINRPNGNCVVVYKDREGDYGGGLAKQINWDKRIKEFQILKDLKP